MRFYGFNWEYMMAMSLRLFWSMVKNMHRIRAQEQLRQIRIVSLPNIDESARTEYINEQVSTLGTITVSDERDTDIAGKLAKFS